MKEGGMEKLGTWIVYLFHLPYYLSFFPLFETKGPFYTELELN